jgi:hypothetical protein
MKLRRAAAGGGAWLLLAHAISLFGQDARQIVEESQRRARASSQRYEGDLEVISAGSKVSRKTWESTRIGSFGNSKTVLRFTAPAEVKGVALLVINHPDRSSDQWMWTPAVGRDRRIALQDRSTRFFGTDFTYEDLEERDVDKSSYRMMGEESIDGASCWKIEASPKPEAHSQYTRVTIWVRKDYYVFARIEMFARNELARRLFYSNFERVQGIWTARRLEMHDLKAASYTILTLDKLDYNLALRPENFTLQALRRE